MEEDSRRGAHHPFDQRHPARSPLDELPSRSLFCPMTTLPITSAILLAAGSGTRVWPYNEVRNKCALPVANVPNIRRLADSLHEIGVTRLVVAVGTHGGSVRHALLGAKARVEFVEPPVGSGTAGAVRAGLTVLDDARFLVVYGDT